MKKTFEEIQKEFQHNSEPITDEEIAKVASGKFETLPALKKRDISESIWTVGFIDGTRNAIDQMGEFGLSDYEIRNSLGMIKR